ncbi:hypothetical protein [Streptomyces shenzhenensis]|uniref:hypothetical protein n=1 Tax=Streptomyces shenzhenensis TaxID=943815 RepID=UPI0033D8A8B8
MLPIDTCNPAYFIYLNRAITILPAGVMLPTLKVTMRDEAVLSGVKLAFTCDFRRRRGRKERVRHAQHHQSRRRLECG